MVRAWFGFLFVQTITTTRADADASADSETLLPPLNRHQAGREGAEWFEAAEKLGAAIDSLLELRSKPDYDSVAFTGLRRKEQRT